MGKVIYFESRRNALPQADDDKGPIEITIEGNLAAKIRYSAGMVCKTPEGFLLDWLQAGFPEHAA